MKSTYLLTALVFFLFGACIGVMSSLLIAERPPTNTYVLNVQPTELERLEMLEAIAQMMEANGAEDEE